MCSEEMLHAMFMRSIYVQSFFPKTFLMALNASASPQALSLLLG